MPVEIPLTQGYVALVDEADAERVLTRKWCIHRNGVYRYAASGVLISRGKYRTLWMHRFILDVSDRLVCVDHKDHDGLNNQRCNLRPATRSQNAANQRIDVAQANNPNGYRGVAKMGRLYYAQIKADIIKIRTPGYQTAVEAAVAYDALAVKHFGEFAAVNFPQAAA